MQLQLAARSQLNLLVWTLSKFFLLFRWKYGVDFSVVNSFILYSVVYIWERSTVSNSSLLHKMDSIILSSVLFQCFQLPCWIWSKNNSNRKMSSILFRAMVNDRNRRWKCKREREMSEHMIEGNAIKRAIHHFSCCCRILNVCQQDQLNRRLHISHRTHTFTTILL